MFVVEVCKSTSNSVFYCFVHSTSDRKVCWIRNGEQPGVCFLLTTSVVCVLYKNVLIIHTTHYA